MVIPDVHIGYMIDTPTYSLPCWDLMIQALVHYGDRITHFVIIGDFGNWESMSRWSALRADQVFVEEDIALVNNRLDDIQAITAAHGIKVIFIEGNHEAWATQFEAKYPTMRDMVNLKRRLRMDERVWEWVPENSFWAIGDLHFTHGHIKGVRTPADMIKKTGVSTIYGHNHQYQIASLRNLTGEYMAMSIGCLASIDPPPPYARGQMIDTWVHGLAFARVRSNGMFSVDYNRIVDENWLELSDGTELIAEPGMAAVRYEQDIAIRDDMRNQYAARYYAPGGNVLRTEPHDGNTEMDHKVARTRRARTVRLLPGNSTK
jgi:metallophosphoesterase superfamily enzyme